MQVAFIGNSKDSIYNVYGAERLAGISGVEVFPKIITGENFDSLVGELQHVEAFFTTWGMPGLNEGQIAQLPNLKIIFYGAGSIRGFAVPFFKRNIRIVSAWQINGLAVAEFTFAHLLLAGKGFLRSCRLCTSGWEHRGAAWAAVADGNYKTTVALLGAGTIGRRVLQMIKAETTLKVLLYDPYVTAEAAQALGARKATLEECFQKAQVVSNHVPNLPATIGMIRGEHIRLLPHNGTFINTGRGATVDESSLIAALRERTDITAVLDVTEPEPPVAGSPFYELPNVFLTPHIAGTMHSEWRQMGDFMLEEFDNWRQGKEMRAEITEQMMEKMA